MSSSAAGRQPTLHGLLDAADPSASLHARLAWFEDLARWLRGGGGWLASRRRISSPTTELFSARSDRLRTLREALEQAPPWQQRVSAVLASVLAETQAFTLLCDTGTGRLGFAGEALDRVLKKLIPVPPENRDLGELVARMFPEPDDADWLAELPADELRRFVATLGAPGLFATLRPAIQDSLHVLSLRVAARGFADDIRARTARPIRDSPFYHLAPVCRAFLDAPNPQTRGRLGAAINDCRGALTDAFDSLERSGVSVDLVYRLELQVRNLQRMQALLALLEDGRAGGPIPLGESSQVGKPPERAALDLLATLLRERQASASLAGLLRTSSHQLARKIVERTGHTGEHYITTTRAEYRQMLRSAAGGGVLTAGTAALKFAIGWAKLPLFFEMAALAVSYAGSFLLMQALGFTLATKQPSMTAAALAGSLKESRGKAELPALVELIARITRSQLAAVIGNLGCVIPAAVAVDWMCHSLVGQRFLDQATAEYVLHSLDPWHSLTIPFAMLTGFILWLGSIAAGWLENWAVYRRLPEAVRSSRSVIRLLGEDRAQRIGHALEHGISGVGGNVALGALLGAIPGFGKFFGVPLDVRHITLSTGALTLALCTLGPAHLLEEAGRTALLGLLIVGLLNFGVSFLLALLVAFRARDIRNEAQVLPALLAGLWRSPRRFLLPPRDTTA